MTLSLLNKNLYMLHCFVLLFREENKWKKKKKKHDFSNIFPDFPRGLNFEDNNFRDTSSAFYFAKFTKSAKINPSEI